MNIQEIILLLQQIWMKQKPENTNRNQKIPLFVQKLQEILEGSDNNTIIAWSEDGKSFEIKNAKKFQESILPKYFRHSRMNSFVRQLNMYGFHKNKGSKDLISFYHQNFDKNNLENLVLIRKPEVTFQTKKQSTTDSTESAPMIESLKLIPLKQKTNVYSTQPKLEQPISQLMLQMIQQITSQQLMLESEVRARVDELLRAQPYDKIDRKLTPFILDSLGLDSQRSTSNISHWNTQLFLKTLNFIESLRFII